MSSRRESHGRSSRPHQDRHSGPGHTSHSRKRQYSPDHHTRRDWSRPHEKRPRQHLPGRTYRSHDRESGHQDRDWCHSSHTSQSRHSRAGNHTHQSSYSRTSEATPTPSRLSVDETAPSGSSSQTGVVSYAGSRGNTAGDDWRMGSLVSAPLNEFYCTREETQMLCGTDKLRDLHRLFKESLLHLSTPPPHVSLLANDATPTSVPQEGSCDTASVCMQESADSSEINTLEPHNIAESAIVESSATHEATSRTPATPPIMTDEGPPPVDKEDDSMVPSATPAVSTGDDCVENDGDSETSCPGGGEDSADQDPSDATTVNDKNIPYNTVSEHSRRMMRTAGVGVAPHTGPWHSYSLTVLPATNFQSGVTTITAENGRLYKFRGFLLLTRHPLLEDQRVCKFERYSGVYSVELSPLPTPYAFVEDDLLLFHEYLLVRLLELYDLVAELKPLFKEMLFLPLFIGESHSDTSQEVLSMAEVLNHLLRSFQPLSEGVKGHLVADFSRKPHCLRVDSEWHAKSASGDKKCKFAHCRPAMSRPRGHKADKRKSVRTQYHHLMSKKKKGKLTRKEHFKLVELQRQLEREEGVMVVRGCEPQDFLWFTGDGFHGTGLCIDVVQHTLLLSVVSQHVLLHSSLTDLQQALGYSFKDKSFLHRAITHPSCTTLSYQLAEDHVRTTLTNCGLFEVQSLPMPSKAVLKGLKGLTMSLEGGDKGVWLENNEQLEFLGDAVLEYVCSMRLFHMTPPYPVGQLNIERQKLVKNKTLWQLASQLQLTSRYLLVNKKVGFTEESLRRSGANCLEALLGAVLVDGGVEEADKLYTRLAFTDQEELSKWVDQGKHPLISEHPEGDRHLIVGSEELTSLLPLEERLGLQFTHIRLLGRAFTHPSHPSDTEAISGNYQRLEFLGDAILQFLVSEHLFHKFPSHHEGHLTMLRIALVHNKQLASLCKELGFDDHIIASKTEKLDLTVKLQADVVESFLAALTLDKGLPAAQQFLEKHLFPKLLEVVRGSQLVDPNTQLHQAAAYTCKQQGLSLVLPVYKVSPAGGTPSKPEFTVSVIFGKRKIGSGTGGTIREARRLAALDALQSTSLRIPPSLKEREKTSINTI